MRSAPRTYGTGITWPFCVDYDLKVRVAATDVSGDHQVVLFLLQDFDYLDRSERAAERYAWNWAEVLREHSEVDAWAEVDVVEPPTGGALADHADVLVTLAEWVGAGTVSLMVAEWWRTLRERHHRELAAKRSGTSMVDKRRDADRFARWAIEAQYSRAEDHAYWAGFNRDATLELRSEKTSRDSEWDFTYRGPDGTLYEVKMEQPDGVPFAILVSIRRTLPEKSRPGESPSLTRYWENPPSTSEDNAWSRW